MVDILLRLWVFVTFVVDKVIKLGLWLIKMLEFYFKSSISIIIAKISHSK